MSMANWSQVQAHYCEVRTGSTTGRILIFTLLRHFTGFRGLNGGK